MKTTTNRRQLTASEVAAGFSLRRMVAWEAYPRNGNAHPTQYVRWIVLKDGRAVSEPLRLRRALQLVEEWSE